MSDTSAWAQQCPLCGQHNQCAIALGQPADQCWCMTTPISPLALQQVPAAERGQRCVCPACGQVATESAEASPAAAITAGTKF